MESVILTIITGLFSLAGIWYQNYLSRRSNDVRQSAPYPTQADRPGQNQQPEQLVAKQARPNTLRIIFTILIAALPWFTVKKTQELSDKFFGTNYTTMGTHVKSELVTFTVVWVLIMIIALLSGWSRKTGFERLALIASAVCLICFCFSQTI